MEKQIWPRLGAASGALFVVLLFGGSLLPINEDAKGVVELVGLLLFVPFLGYLFGVLRRAEGQGGWLSATAFGAGLVDLTIKLGSAAPSIAARQTGLDPAAHDALHTMNSASFVLTMLPLGVLVAAVTVLTFKTGVLPSWIGWFGALVAPALLVNGTFLDAEFGPAFLLFLLWTVVTSAVLTRRAGKASVRTSTDPEPAH